MGGYSKFCVHAVQVQVLQAIELVLRAEQGAVDETALVRLLQVALRTAVNGFLKANSCQCLVRGEGCDAGCAESGTAAVAGWLIGVFAWVNRSKRQLLCVDDCSASKAQTIPQMTRQVHLGGCWFCAIWSLGS